MKLYGLLAAIAALAMCTLATVLYFIPWNQELLGNQVQISRVIDWDNMEIAYKVGDQQISNKTYVQLATEGHRIVVFYMEDGNFSNVYGDDSVSGPIYKISEGKLIEVGNTTVTVSKKIEDALDCEVADQLGFGCTIFDRQIEWYPNQ